MGGNINGGEGRGMRGLAEKDGSRRREMLGDRMGRRQMGPAK